MTVLTHHFARARSQQRTLRLGFLCPDTPYDRRSFSGSSHFAARALTAHPNVQLTILGHEKPSFLSRLRPKPALDVTTMDVSGLDAVIGLVATPLLVDLMRQHPNLPLVHVTDATPAYLREAYGWQVPSKADADESLVAHHALSTIYSSAEIARRAPGDLGLPRLRPGVVPFGTNLADRPDTPPEKSDLGALKLLFVGTDWERKGGDIAVAALETLRASGRDAELTVIGKLPETLRNRPGIRYAGYLNKNRAGDLAKLIKHYSEAHLLVLPSRADCTPMVVAEAMAYGTPVIATDVGGIGEMVGLGGIGRVMPLYATAQEWSDAIVGLTDNETAYKMLSDACFDRHFSWDNWADALVDRITQAEESRTQRDLKVAVSC